MSPIAKMPGRLVAQVAGNLKGYQVWADALKPIFLELLGPPATADHAPPPTGDPSAEPRAANPGAAASARR